MSLRPAEAEPVPLFGKRAQRAKCLARGAQPEPGEQEQYEAHVQNRNQAMSTMASKIEFTRSNISFRKTWLNGTTAYRHFSPAAVLMQAERRGGDVEANKRAPIYVFQVVTRAKDYLFNHGRPYYPESRAMLAEFVLHDGKLRQTAFKHRLLQNADAEELQSVFSALFCKARSEPGTYRPHALFDYLVVQMVSNEALRADASHPGHTQIIMADHLSRIVIAFLKQAGVIS